MNRISDAAMARLAMALLLSALAGGCGVPLLDPSLPVYTTEQIDSVHAGFRRTTVSTAGAVYVNDLEEQSLQLIEVEPRKVVGRSKFGNGKICAIEGQDPAVYIAVDMGSEMPAYEVFRRDGHPPFDWRHAIFQKLRLTVPMGPAANKETADASVIDDVVRTLRDGTPVKPPLAPMPMTVGAASTGVYGVLLFSDEIPGLAFRPSCYLAPSGEVYLADSLVFTFTRPLPTIQADWISASPLFARWATTP